MQKSLLLAKRPANARAGQRPHTKTRRARSDYPAHAPHATPRAESQKWPSSLSPWLDYAIIGLKSEGPSKSSNWPADVECDNGIIHAIDTVLVPGAYDGSR